MSPTEIAILGAGVSVVVSCVGLFGSFLTSRTSSKTAKEVANLTSGAQQELAKQNLLGQRVLARDAAIRERREKAANIVLGEVIQHASSYFRAHTALRNGDRDRARELLSQEDDSQAYLDSPVLAMVSQPYQDAVMRFAESEAKSWRALVAFLENRSNKALEQEVAAYEHLREALQMVHQEDTTFIFELLMDEQR